MLLPEESWLSLAQILHLAKTGLFFNNFFLLALLTLTH